MCLVLPRYLSFLLLFLKTRFCLFRFFKDFIFREKGREGERERNISVGHLLHAPHWGPFCSQAGTQSTEPHQPGIFTQFYREEKGGRRTGRETVMDYVASHSGTEPTVLTGNRTSELSFCRTMPNQLNHTGQSLRHFSFLKKSKENVEASQLWCWVFMSKFSFVAEVNSKNLLKHWLH